MRFRSILRQRPSAPMAVSLVALFMSMGGVGYAAISLPANSVGSDQIRNEAVTYKKIRPNAVGVVRLADNGVTNAKIRDGAVSYKKIQPNAVGKVRANLDQLQARISTACGSGSAIGAVDKTGAPTCAFPAQVGAADKTTATTVDTTGTTVNSVTLPAGSSYLVFANPTLGAAGSCTLTVGTISETRSVPAGGSVALQVAGPAGTATVACKADSGTTTANSAINALHVAG